MSIRGILLLKKITIAQFCFQLYYGFQNHHFASAIFITCDSTIMVKKDSEFSINLRAMTSAGYSWELADSAFAEFLIYERQTFKITSNQPGSAGIQTFVFKGRTKGKTLIRFVYVQPFMKPNPFANAKKVFKVIVY